MKTVLVLPLSLAFAFLVFAKPAAKKEESYMTVQEYKFHVEKTMNAKIQDVVACKKKTKANGGRITFAWEMDEKGRAQSITRAEDTINNEPFYHCVMKKIEKIKFKKPPDGRPIDVSHLYVL